MNGTVTEQRPAVVSAYAGSPGEFERACTEDYIELMSRPGGRGVVEEDAVACREAVEWVRSNLGAPLARLAAIRATVAESILALSEKDLDDKIRRRQWRQSMKRGG